MFLGRRNVHRAACVADAGVLSGRGKVLTASAGRVLVSGPGFSAVVPASGSCHSLAAARVAQSAAKAKQLLALACVLSRSSNFAHVPPEPARRSAVHGGRTWGVAGSCPTVLPSGARLPRHGHAQRLMSSQALIGACVYVSPWGLQRARGCVCVCVPVRCVCVCVCVRLSAPACSLHARTCAFPRTYCRPSVLCLHGSVWHRRTRTAARGRRACVVKRR